MTQRASNRGKGSDRGNTSEWVQERRKRKGGTNRHPPLREKLRLKVDKLFKYELRKRFINMNMFSITRNQIHTILNQNEMSFSYRINKHLNI